LTEAENPQGDEFSRERLLQVVREHSAANAQEIYDVVRARASEFRETEGFDDDLTLIVLKALM
jgi:serine phosphatase RsbU (regulator of sigma subunit)